MENQKNDNLNLLEAVVQNTEMGKNTLEQILLPPEIWMPRSRSSQMAYRRCQQLAALSSSSSPATATLRVKGTRFIIPIEVTHSWGISA